MTTAELTSKIRQNRQSLNHKYIAKLKQEIHQIRVEIVGMSLLTKPDVNKHQSLISRLKVARDRLKAAQS